MKRKYKNQWSQILAMGLVTAALAGCSSTPKVGVEHAGERETLGQMGGDRPDWVEEHEGQPLWFEDGKLYSLGSAVISPDQSLANAYRIAESHAKNSVASAVSQRLEFIFQNSQEGSDADSSHTRFVGTETARLTASNLRLDRRYYERVRTVQENGQPKIELHVFALVAMDETDFRAAVVQAAKNGQKSGVSRDFMKRIEERWDAFVDDEAAPARSTASEAEDEEDAE